MENETKQQPEASTSKQQLPPAESSTRAVLDFLRLGAHFEDNEKEKLWERPSTNPSVEALAALGIKTRDFAYESKLPPLRSWVPSRQVRTEATEGGADHRTYAHPNPRTRPLKRTRRDGTEEEDHGYGFVMGVARIKPGDDGADNPRKAPRRENAVLSLDEEAELRAAAWDVFGSGGDSQPQSQSQSYSQPQEYSQSQSQSQGYSQPYSQEYSQPGSQETEPLIATPFVTPNGSLQWIPDPPTDPESAAGERAKTPMNEDPERSVSPPTGLARTFSNLSTLSSPLSEPPPSQPLPQPVARTPTPTPAAVQAPATPTPPPRYQLRKRTVPMSPPKRRGQGRPPMRRQNSNLTLVIQS
ncbi:hypothetical protein C8R43DRAFT_972719 [Mycena crocata]|nr:hypothetical protein C8R43DRAFT_972719 [Mycena crocata]